MRQATKLIDATSCMEFESQAASEDRAQMMIAQAAGRELLVWLRDVPRSLRHRTLLAIAPVLPEASAINLSGMSHVAEETMNSLAQIDLNAIDAVDLQPARLEVGLCFTGVGAVAMVLLLMYLSALHPELSVTGASLLVYLYLVRVPGCCRIVDARS